MEQNLASALSNINTALSILNGAMSDISAGDSDYQSQITALEGVTVFDDQELTPFSVDVTSANSAGNTAIASYDQGIPTDHCAFLKLIPGGQAYANAYFFKDRKLTLPNVTKYKYEGRIMLPTSSDCSASQALELDVEQRLSGICKNIGFQWDFAEKVLRVWNRGPATGSFVHGWNAIPATSLARWSPLVWHEFEFNAHADANNVYYDDVVLDGTSTDLSSFSFPVISLAEADCMNNAIQLDGDSAGVTYQAYIDAIKLTVS